MKKWLRERERERKRKEASLRALKGSIIGNPTHQPPAPHFLPQDCLCTCVCWSRCCFLYLYIFLSPCLLLHRGELIFIRPNTTPTTCPPPNRLSLSHVQLVDAGMTLVSLCCVFIDISQMSAPKCK